LRQERAGATQPPGLCGALSPRRVPVYLTVYGPAPTLMILAGA
jgi:hypothetical protein